MYISILFFRKQATRAHTQRAPWDVINFLLLWSSALLSVLVLIFFFVTIFLCSVFVSRSFAAALPFQRLYVPRNYRSPYTLDLEKKLTSACIGLLGRRGL